MLSASMPMSLVVSGLFAPNLLRIVEKKDGRLWWVLFCDSAFPCYSCIREAPRYHSAPFRDVHATLMQPGQVHTRLTQAQESHIDE